MIPSIDALTLVITGGILILYAQPNTPDRYTAFALFLIGMFTLIIGALPTLLRVLGL